MRGIAGCSVGSGGRHPGKFTDEVFDRAAESFENPDFVDAVVHAYRFVHGKEAGDPALDDRERKLAGKPKIAVPCIMLDGTLDPLKPGASVSHAEMFAGRHEPRVSCWTCVSCRGTRGLCTGDY